jgi:Tfp pilus assembly protein PilO
MIVGVSVVALFVVLFGWLTWGEWEEYQKIDAELKQLETEIAALNAKIVKIPDMRKTRDTLVERFEEKRKILPNKAERENLIEVISYLCEKTGMPAPLDYTPVDAKKGPGARQATGGIEEILYQVKLEGTFFAFIRFANWLEHYKRHIRIRTFAITGGGGVDTATKESVELKYDVLLVSYQYTGAAGAEDEKALVLEEPKINPMELIEIEPDARDPFRFPLVLTVTTPGEPTGTVPGDQSKTEQELIRVLDEKLDIADRLRRDIVKQTTDTPMSKLKEILDAHMELTVFLSKTRALGPESGRRLAELRTKVQELDGLIPQVLYPLWAKRIAEVTALVDDHTENRRYADVVLPTLALVSQFRDFSPNPQVEQGLAALFGKVTGALTALVEELSEYKRTIDLITQIDKEIGPLRNSKLTTLYARFLDSLKDIKKKAEDIKLFRELNIAVTGLIWGKEKQDRICIVHADKLAGTDPVGSKFRRRLFVEDEVVGTVKGSAADAVVIKSITRDKKVIFEFRKLSIAVELGDEK